MSRQWCTDHFWATLQSPSSCDCPYNLTVRVHGDVFFLSFFPCVYTSLVTTGQLRMKYGTNYPIMSEKGSELAGAWLKSNLTLISPNPLAGSNWGFKSYFRISYEHTHKHAHPTQSCQFFIETITVISICIVMPCQQDVSLHQTNAFVKVMWQHGWIW